MKKYLSFLLIISILITCVSVLQFPVGAYSGNVAFSGPYSYVGPTTTTYKYFATNANDNSNTSTRNTVNIDESKTVTVTENQTLTYWLHTPIHYDSSINYPVMVYCSGSGCTIFEHENFQTVRQITTSSEEFQNSPYSQYYRQSVYYGEQFWICGYRDINGNWVGSTTVPGNYTNDTAAFLEQWYNLVYVQGKEEYDCFVIYVQPEDEAWWENHSNLKALCIHTMAQAKEICEEYGDDVVTYSGGNYNSGYIANELSPNVFSQLTVQLIDQLSETYSIDDKRQYIAGFSLGAQFSFDTISHYPNRFACSVFSGLPASDVTEENAKRLMNMNIWTFNGASDFCNKNFSLNFVSKVDSVREEYGGTGDAKATICSGGHSGAYLNGNSTYSSGDTYTKGSTDIIDFMFDSVRTDYEVTGVSVVVSESLSVKLYTNIPYALNDVSFVKTKINDREYTIEAENNDRYCVFSVKGVAPQEMSDEISVELYYQNELCYSNNFTVKQLLINMLDTDFTAVPYNYSPEKATATNYLISNLLKYGGAAQNYCGTSDTISTGITTENYNALINTNSIEGGIKEVSSSSNENTCFISVGLYYTTMNRFYFDVSTTENLSNVSVLVNGNVCTDVIKINGGYRFHTDGILISAMNETQNAVLKVGGTTVQTVSYNLASYATAFGNTNMGKLAKATYYLNTSALDYLDADNTNVVVSPIVKTIVARLNEELESSSATTYTDIANAGSIITDTEMKVIDNRTRGYKFAYSLATNKVYITNNAEDEVIYSNTGISSVPADSKIIVGANINNAQDLVDVSTVSNLQTSKVPTSANIYVSSNNDNSPLVIINMKDDIDMSEASGYIPMANWENIWNRTDWYQIRILFNGNNKHIDNMYAALVGMMAPGSIVRDIVISYDLGTEENPFTVQPSPHNQKTENYHFGLVAREIVKKGAVQTYDNVMITNIKLTGTTYWKDTSSKIDPNVTGMVIGGVMNGSATIPSGTNNKLVTFDQIDLFTEEGDYCGFKNSTPEEFALLIGNPEKNQFIWSNIVYDGINTASEHHSAFHNGYNATDALPYLGVIA